MQDLVEQLEKQLGVSTAQARGGAALVLGAARDKLGAATFDDSIGRLPGMAELLGAAPRPKGLGRLLGGVASRVGGNRAAMIAAVLGGFSQLGMKPSHAEGFVPIMVEHLRSRLDPATAARVEELLRA